MRLWCITPVKKLLPAICIFVVAADASAQLVYEPFNYPAASNLDNQVNPGNAQAWSKMSSSPDTDDNIVLARLESVDFGACACEWKQRYIRRSRASERLGLGQEFASGTFYYSMAFEVTSALSPTPAYIAGFSEAAGTSDVQPQHIGTRLYLRQGSIANTFNIGVSKNSGNPDDISFDTTDFSLNTPIFVVGSYKIVGSGLGTDDQSTLYINPASNSFGAARGADGVHTLFADSQCADRRHRSPRHDRG